MDFSGVISVLQSRNSQIIPAGLSKNHCKQMLYKEPVCRVDLPNNHGIWHFRSFIWRESTRRRTLDYIFDIYRPKKIACGWKECRTTSSVAFSTHYAYASVVRTWINLQRLIKIRKKKRVNKYVFMTITMSVAIKRVTVYLFYALAIATTEAPTGNNCLERYTHESTAK